MKLSRNTHLMVIAGFCILLFCALGGFLWLNYMSVNVDEDLFCTGKVNSNFPEYEFNSIYYSGQKCVGHLQDIVSYEQRDGLVRTETTTTNQEIVYFNLASENDREYLQSDDWAGTLLVSWLVIVILLVYFLLRLKV
jgi:hypothetical protein